MRYTLTDGSTMTPEELTELVPHMTCRNARCRLGRTRDRDKLLKPVRLINNEGRPIKKYMLSDGNEYTITELMELTGCKYATMVSRLHASADKDSERILKKATLSLEEQEMTTRKLRANERMFNDPDGFWKLFNRYV